MFGRWVQESFREKLKRPFVHLLFGARQTGKSTQTPILTQTVGYPKESIPASSAPKP